MAATKLAFSFVHYDVRIKGYDLKFRREEFEYAYFIMMKKKQGVKFSSQWYFNKHHAGPRIVRYAIKCHVTSESVAS